MKRFKQMTNHLLMGGARQPKGPGAAPEKIQTEKSKVDEIAAEIIDKIWPAHQRMVIIVCFGLKLNWQSQLFYTPS